VQLSVVILAAGHGKRMNSGLPKVLQPLAAKPLLQHVIETARGLNPTNIFVVYGHGGAEVQAALRAAPVDWVLQAEQLGTGHAVMQAMPLIPDEHAVLVLYGDVPLLRPETLRSLLGARSGGQAGDGMAVLSVNLEDPAGYGRILRGADGRVRAIVEHKDASAAELQIREINTGVMAFQAKAAREWLLGLRNDNSQGEYYLTDVVAAAVAGGAAVQAVRADSATEVLGVNDKVQLAQAESAYRMLRARELMLAGATLADPARIDVRGRVAVGRDVYIDVNAVLIGEVGLGDRVTIGPNCTIRDSTIGADTEVHANCVIDRAIVADHCVIGPFARLRPDAVLARDVHIGNFVEVKNSSVGAGSKANHLTYLGDAEVGSGVNVGAGTITCNYDGANKWPTVIEDNAFIGSGSMLVAPVRIGAGATIGAGSAIGDNAPAGTLTLTRAKQATVANWRRPVKLDEPAKAAAVDAALQMPTPRPPKK
jgi:bifunctional UDP-N-acetylglucosamine pyrophosphorylase/glucosamine-1-phosphate N-acetyltransferase